MNLTIHPIFVTLLSLGILTCCSMDSPKNYVDYKNFSDDHSLDYRQMLKEQIQKEKIKKKREQEKAKEDFFYKFDLFD